MMNRRNFNSSLLGLFGAAAIPGISTERLIDPYVNRFTVEKHLGTYTVKICSPECLEDMKKWCVAEIDEETCKAICAVSNSKTS